MNQRSSAPSHTAGHPVSVEMVARLALRHLTDDQLIELLTRLEYELVKRASPVEDQLLSERPADS